MKYYVNAAKQKNNRRDFLLGDIMTLTEKAKKVSAPSDFVYSWNQATNKRSRMFCTAVAPMCAILSYWEMRWDASQRKDFWHYAVDNHGYREGEGHWMSVGIDAARKYWNIIHPEKEMMSFRTDWDSGEYWDAINRGFHAITGYKGNATWNIDAHDNGILNKTAHGVWSYGHIRREKKETGTHIRVVDNYAGRREGNRNLNEYLVPRGNMPHLIRKGNNTGYFPSAYFMLPVSEISNVPSEVLKGFIALMRARSKMREKIDASNPKDKLQLQLKLHEENEWWRKRLGIT